MSDRLFLLDTSVVVALVRGKALGQLIDATYGLRAAPLRPMVSIVSHGELRVVASRNGWGVAKLEALQNALENLVTVNINHSDVLEAYAAIDLFSQAHPDGARNMGKNDLWIAACAKATGATLLTTDEDFSHLAPAVLSVEVIAADPSGA